MQFVLEETSIDKCTDVGEISIVNIVNLYYVHGFLEGTVMDGSDFTNLGKL